MGQHRALGIAGSAGGVLDVYRVVREAIRLSRHQLLSRNLRVLRDQFIPGPHSGGRFSVRAVAVRWDANDVSQVGKLRAAKLSGVRVFQLRHNFVDHRGIVGVAKPANQNEGVGFGLFQHISQLMGSIGRIHVDHDCANLGGGELGQHPLAVIGGPDAHVMAALNAQGHQPAGHALHLIAELHVGVPLARLHINQRVPLGKALRLPVQDIADSAVGVDAAGRFGADYVISHIQPRFKKFNP